MPDSHVERLAVSPHRNCSRHADQRAVAVIYGHRPTGYGNLANYTRYACELCAGRAEARLTNERPSPKLET